MEGNANKPQKTQTSMSTTPSNLPQLDDDQTEEVGAVFGFVPRCELERQGVNRSSSNCHLLMGQHELQLRFITQGSSNAELLIVT